MKPILLFGHDGQLGYELERTLAPFGPVVTPGPEEADFLAPDEVVAAVRRHDPSLVVNAAAYTQVDRAEEDEANAMTVNGTVPGMLAAEAKRLNIPLIHYSTDYVFDGSAKAPYTEGDACAPAGVYGRTKHAGEKAIAASGCTYLTFRTSWLYGMRGQNFLLTMRRLAGERDALSIVDDQFGAPTWCRLVAEATAGALARRRTDGLKEVSGLYHLTASGETSWCGFAREIFGLSAARDRGFRIPEVQPVTTDEYPTPAKRPAYSVLSNALFHDVFGFSLPDWRVQLRLCLNGGNGA